MKREVFNVAGARERAKREELARRAKAAMTGEKLEDGSLEIEMEDGKPVLQVRGYVGYTQIAQLEEIFAEGAPAELLVRINSGGGSAFAGLEIANRLRGADTDVTTRNESAAMSAAALIFMAGDERLAGDMGSLTMFHRAMGWLEIWEFGNVEALKKVDVQKEKDMEIDLLESLDASILSILEKETKLSRKEAEEAIVSEKNFTSKEAVRVGIATGLYEKPKTDDAEDESEAASEEDAETAERGGEAATVGSGTDAAETVAEDGGTEAAVTGTEDAEAVTNETVDAEAVTNETVDAETIIADATKTATKQADAARSLEELAAATQGLRTVVEALSTRVDKLESVKSETAEVSEAKPDGTETPGAGETSSPEGSNWRTIMESAREELAEWPCN